MSEEEKADVDTGLSPRRRCFVIAPIGRDGSDARKRSDQILRHIIDPVVAELGYDKPLRADRISESGRITRQIIQHIVEDELVIADLTDSNPNVYYELALRHAIRKPFVQILAGGDPLPFDVADQRTIMLDHKDLDSVHAAKSELKRQVEALIGGSAEIDTPLTFALDISSLRSSDNPGDRTQGEILDLLQEIRQSQIQAGRSNRPGPVRLPDRDLEVLRRYVEITSRHGDVTIEDLVRLIDMWTSPGHDRWVESVRLASSPLIQTGRPVEVYPPMEESWPTLQDGPSEAPPST